MQSKGNITGVLLLSGVLFNIATWAQNTLVSNFQNIDHTSGLPSNEVIAIESDSSYRWFATSSGLVRYDGYYCLPIKVCADNNSEKPPPAIQITTLFMNNQVLWVGTARHGVYVRQAGDLCLKKADLGPYSGEIAAATITSFCTDSQKRLWIATGSNKLYRYDPENKWLHEVQFENKNCSILNITYDPVGTKIWALTATEITLAIQEQDLSEIAVPKLPYTAATAASINNNSKSIAVDRSGTVWVSVSGKGLFYHPQNSKGWVTCPLQPISYGDIRKIVTGPDDKIYCALSKSGIYVLDPHDWTYQFYPGNFPEESKLNTLIFKDIYIDSNSNIWVGGSGNGVEVLYRPKRDIEFISTRSIIPASPKYHPILAVYPGRDPDKLWMSTDGAGMLQYDRKTQQFSPVKIEQGSASSVKTLYTDRQGHLWLGHWQAGLGCYDPATGRQQHYRDLNNGPYQLEGLSIWAMEEDQLGHFWVSCLGDGLVKFSNDGKNREVYFKKELAEHYNVLDLLCDAQGTLWAAFEQHGIARLFKNSTKFVMTDATSCELNSNNIRCLFEDSKGRIWAGTADAGLRLWDGNKFLAYTAADGLLSDEIQSIAEDKDGLYWVQSPKGASVLQFTGSQLTHITHVLSTQLNVFNHNSTYITPDGEVYIGGSHELFVANKSGTFNQPTKARALISNIRTTLSTRNTQPLQLLSAAYATGEITLDGKEGNLFVDFSCTDINNISQVEYQYKIEPQDNTWITLGKSEHTISLSHLDAGNYTLRVRCRTGLSDWGETTSLKIRLQQPIWGSVRILYVFIPILLLLAVFLFIQRWRNSTMLAKKKQLEAERILLETQKTKLAQEIEIRDSELMSKSAEMAHQSQRLTDIVDMLSVLKNDSDNDKNLKIRKISKALESSINRDEEWDSFKIYFDKTNQDFTRKLTKDYPQLTNNDILMAILIKLRMSGKEMALLLNVSNMGIQKSKYRLKKRLNLGENDDLRAFILKYESET